MSKLNEEVESETALSRFVDDALLYLSCSDAPKKVQNIPVVMITEQSLRRFKKQRQEIGRPYAVEKDEIPPLWETAILMSGDRKEAKGARYEIGHTKKLSFSERMNLKNIGLISKPMAQVARSSQLTLMDDGKFREKEFLCYEDYRQPDNPYTPLLGQSSLPTGKVKYRVTSGGNWSQYEELQSGQETLMPSLCQSVTWICSHVWQVIITQHNSAQLSLLTDASGVKGFFKLRDIADGANRRSALLHWVREHWRTNRSDPDDEVKVRAHVRGKEKFSWFGFTGQVIIPREVEKRLDTAAV